MDPKFKLIKRGKTNRKWTHEEVQIILNYMKEVPELEVPTAQIYYKKLIAKTGINVSWELIRWKVRHLKATFKKAIEWQNSKEAGVLESDSGASVVEGKILQICPYYNQLFEILDKKCNDQPTKTNQQVFPACDNEIINNAESESPMFNYSILEIDDDMSIKKEIVELRNTASPVQDSNDLDAQSSSTATPMQLLTDLGAQSSYTATAKNAKELGEKLKKFGQKFSSSACLASFQAERTAMLKLKLAWEKEKHDKELLLSEKKIKLKEEKQQAEIELKKRKLELKAIAIEKDEKLKTLQMEKDERIQKFEIEMAYKYRANENNNFK